MGEAAQLFHRIRRTQAETFETRGKRGKLRHGVHGLAQVQVNMCYTTVRLGCGAILLGCHVQSYNARFWRMYIMLREFPRILRQISARYSHYVSVFYHVRFPSIRYSHTQYEAANGAALQRLGALINGDVESVRRMGDAQGRNEGGAALMGWYRVI